MIDFLQLTILLATDDQDIGACAKGFCKALFRNPQRLDGLFVLGNILPIDRDAFGGRIGFSLCCHVRQCAHQFIDNAIWPLDRHDPLDNMRITASLAADTIFRLIRRAIFLGVITQGLHQVTFLWMYDIHPAKIAMRLGALTCHFFPPAPRIEKLAGLRRHIPSPNHLVARLDQGLVACHTAR